jgi:hypothetical protein
MDLGFGMMVFAIPIVAIIGGIAVAIVKIVGQQRNQELARRERIAAIERGLDPSSLPTVAEDLPTPSERVETAKTRQGLLIGGLATLFAGFGLGFMLFFLETGQNTWAVGAIPVCVGIALLLSYALIKPPANGNRSRAGTPPMS